MAHYLRIALNIFFFAGVYGLLLPWMISQPDDFLVISGFVIAIVVAPAIMYYANKMYLIKTLEKLK